MEKKEIIIEIFLLIALFSILIYTSIMTGYSIVNKNSLEKSLIGDLKDEESFTDENYFISKELNIGFEFLEIEQKSGLLLINYSIDEIANKDRKIEIIFKLRDKENSLITEKKQNVFIEANSKRNFYSEKLEGLDFLNGEFYLFVLIRENLNSDKFVKKIYLFSKKGITASIIKSGDESVKDLFILVPVLAIILFFCVRFIINHHKKINKEETNRRQIIRLSINKNIN